MAYILSLDQGTTSSRAIVFDEHGGVVASAQREFPQIYPQAGWVEHDPMAILGSQLEAAAEAIEKAIDKVGVAARRLAGIGIANQRETAIVWDRETGQPIYNAIVWQDRRTAEFCDRLRAERAESAVREKTGLVIDSYFSGTKIGWILDHVAGARQRAEAGQLAFGTVDSWLIWNLTGGQRHVTDFTNASRTMLFNIRTGQWDADLLRLLRVPESLMPEVVASSGRLGITNATTSSANLRAITLAGMAGDQQAALFGQLCLTPGEAKNTYGTGCFLLKHIGEKFVLSEHRLVTTLACSLDGTLAYALEGSVFIGGAVVQWLRDNLKLIHHSSEIGALARTVSDNGGVVLVPAFVGLGAPHWDPYAGGLLIGLRRDTQPGHIARAAEECIAFQVADVVEAMDREAGTPVRELRVDGGAAGDDLLLQFQADLLGIPVVRPANTETTALGVAYLAGLAVGVWDGAGALRDLRREEVRFTPRLDRSVAAALRRRWQAAVARSRGWDQQ